MINVMSLQEFLHIRLNLVVPSLHNHEGNMATSKSQTKKIRARLEVGHKVLFFFKQCLLSLVENELRNEHNISVLLPCVLPNRTSYS